MTHAPDAAAGLSEGRGSSPLLAESRLDDWLEAAAATPLREIYNDGRGLALVPFWEYALRSGRSAVETAFSWFPDEDLAALKPLVDWVTSVRDALLVHCTPHPDLISREGCRYMLPTPEQQASLDITNVVAGEPGVGTASATGAWHLPGDIAADMAEQVRLTLQPVLAADFFTGEVTATVVAVRDDGGFYATAEDPEYERVCFVRWTPDRVLSSCQRLLGEVFGLPAPTRRGTSSW